MEVICDHGKESCGSCIHSAPHERYIIGCSCETCGSTGEWVQCIPVEAKKDCDNLLGRLKGQIEKIAENTPYKNEVDVAGRLLGNQMVIMEALVALLEAR